MKDTPVQVSHYGFLVGAISGRPEFNNSPGIT